MDEGSYLFQVGDMDWTIPPLDAMALVQTAHDPPCEGATWTLSTRTNQGESWEDVATGSLVALSPLESLSNTWQADLPTLEAQTDYALWVEESTDGWLVWQTGTTLTSQRGLVLELAIESMTLVEVSTGTEVRVEALITGVRSDEMPLPVVQIAPMDGEPGHILFTEEGEASVLVHDDWPETGEDSHCVHARQLAAGGPAGQLHPRLLGLGRDHGQQLSGLGPAQLSLPQRQVPLGLAQAAQQHALRSKREPHGCGRRDPGQGQGRRCRRGVACPVHPRAPGPIL